MPVPKPNAFDRLTSDIVRGLYPPGSRLPPERELARLLGASRPTLREALGRLGEWGLIAARRGSGIVVRDRRDWSLAALPAFLRLGAARLGPDGLGRTVTDLLALRRSLLVELVRVVGARVPEASLAEARAAVERAWTGRRDLAAFVRDDLAATRALIEGADFLPALWLLNGLGGVYQEVARSITVAPPPDYLASWRAVLDALEKKKPDRAARALGDYLDRHDRRLLGALGVRA
jgi:DNA-binding FadR family transcriptional regulator